MFVPYIMEKIISLFDWDYTMYVPVALLYAAAMIYSGRQLWLIFRHSRSSLLDAVAAIAILGAMLWMIVPSLHWLRSTLHHQARFHICAVLAAVGGCIVSTVWRTMAYRRRNKPTPAGDDLKAAPKE